MVVRAAYRVPLPKKKKLHKKCFAEYFVEARKRMCNGYGFVCDGDGITVDLYRGIYALNKWYSYANCNRLNFSLF